jgi:hypothetical protein
MTREGRLKKKHVSIEYFRIAGITAHMAPIGLHVYAEDFLETALAAGAKEEFAPARVFLVCRAVELALKAFLSLKGVPLMKLAGGQFGHDLANVLAEAEKHGLADLVELTESERDEIERASTYYVEKVLEYPALAEAMVAYPGMPRAGLIASAARKLLEALREPCLSA